jgi:hypothetical protein
VAVAGSQIPQADVLPGRSDAGFVYVVGRLHARFPSLGAQREYAQITRSDPDALVRTAPLRAVLSASENRYLARQICWVFSGPSSDACLVQPRDGNDLDELIEALTDDDSTVQVLVGSPASAPVAALSCLATGLPAVWPDQLLSFRRDEFLDALAEAADGGEWEHAEAWRRIAGDLFDNLTQRTENQGIAAAHRAMNFIALHYPPIYQLTFDAHREESFLIGVDAHVGGAGSDRTTVDVRLGFRNVRTHVVQRYVCRVDVTDLFPFLTSPITVTYD